MSTFTRCDAGLALSISLILLSGCGRGGPPKYPVSGNVSVDGKPIETGDILFVPSDPKQGPTAGKIQAGKFRFEAVAGPHRVEIRALRPIPGAAPMLGEYPQENYLPARYHAESKLEATVTPEGPNNFDFELDAERS